VERLEVVFFPLLWPISLEGSILTMERLEVVEPLHRLDISSSCALLWISLRCSTTHATFANSSQLHTAPLLRAVFQLPNVIDDIDTMEE
jgi:hypothetical protein